ncbi:hypothetical protein I6A60_00525 [Frankia sp. AgB1.9]|uniref:hypothetical protein n=1 Tax=unclassified Frankia TaxID=2632575 RepID=UPI001932A2B0|nr:MULTISPECIES: hypothetical protein [unclassified Frankia]MBL7546373.1 hypothetical protein [Frankia sp. AgB1.9]
MSEDRIRTLEAERSANFETGRADGYRWASDIAVDLDQVDAIALMDPLRPRLAMVWRIGRQDLIRDAAAAVGALTDAMAPLPDRYPEGFQTGARQFRDEIAPLIAGEG